VLFTFSTLFEATNGLFAWSQGLTSPALDGGGAGGDTNDLLYAAYLRPRAGIGVVVR
jgi:hypothetical protein